MPTVFISYSSADLKVAREFQDLIESLGYEVWIDKKRIGPRQEWRKSIESGLKGADWLLVLVSRKAAQSQWVAWEAAWAIENLPDRIIPVVLDGTKPAAVDPRLEKLQAGKFKADPRQCTNQLIKILSDARHAGYRNDIVGRWISAVQPVYYGSAGWHVQDVEISASFDAYTVFTLPSPDKLQWRLDAKLVSNAFLAGPWHSTRPGSRSQGYMSLQLARNGTYLSGHDYALAVGEAEAHFGVMLLSRTEEHLNSAWKSMKKAQRKMAPLTRRVDFKSGVSKPATRT